MGRRVSKKIGAGKGGRKAKAADDDYAPVAKKTKAPIKKEKVVENIVETKTHQRFAEMFSAKPKPKPKPAASKSASPAADSAAEDDFYSDDDFTALGKNKKAVDPTPATSAVVAGRAKRAAATKASAFMIDDDDDMSDDDFESLGKIASKPAAAPPKAAVPTPSDSISPPPAEPASDDVTMDDAPEEPPVEAPTKRAAASKAKTWLVDTDSDDDNMLGDVGDLVKGIGAPATNSKVGRVSLHAMSQSGGPNGSVLPKAKAKSSRTFEVDSMDDTNYEALAMSSPRKSTKGDDIDGFLSDDDVPVSKPAPSKGSTAAAKPKAPLAVVPTAAKRRGRPAGAKNKSKDDEDEPVPAKPKAATKSASAAAKPKAKTAAKPAAAKPVALSPAAKAYAKKKATRVISDDEDEDDVEAAPAPAARARPGRAAAAKAKPIVLESSDVDDSFNTAAGDDDKDDFSMEDSEF